MSASLRLWIIGVFAAAAFTGCATTRPAPDAEALRVQVNVPPTLNFMLEDRIAEAVIDRVEEIFHQNGFARPVTVVPYIEDATRLRNLLTIDLTEWRLTPGGTVDCTFRARLKTPLGERDLGLYSNTALRWVGGFGRLGRARAFADALDGAIRDLYLDVARTELLPGVRTAADPRVTASLASDRVRA